MHEQLNRREFLRHAAAGALVLSDPTGLVKKKPKRKKSPPLDSPCNF